RGEPFAVQSWTLSLLELLRDPRCDHYRFSAEVRHFEGTFEGMVGLYFAYSRGGFGDDVHCFCTLTFNDVETSAAHATEKGFKENRLVLRLWQFRPGPDPDRSGAFFGALGVAKAFTPAFRNYSRKEPWRKIAVEVRPS